MISLTSTTALVTALSILIFNLATFVGIIWNIVRTKNIKNEIIDHTEAVGTDIVNHVTATAAKPVIATQLPVPNKHEWKSP